MDADITPEEVTKVIDELANGKAPGPDDGIPGELYKALKEELKDHITDLFNLIMITGDIPQQFRIGAIVSLYKKEDKLDVNNYRGFMLLSILGKIFNYVLNKRITRYCTSEKS